MLVSKVRKTLSKLYVQVLIGIVAGAFFVIPSIFILWTLSFIYAAYGKLAWVAAIFLILSGGFSIFEGWAGWCVVRAMGVKTRF